MLSTEKIIPPSVQDSTNASPIRRHHHRHNVKSRYEFIKTLGKGTYGKVKLARHKETNKLVAVKAIKKDKIKDTTDMKHIRREMDIMSSIRHPHIIQIYEVFENHDKIVIVMEYAPGGELYDHLANKHLISEEDAKSFFRQIISAVRYCHQHGIVHRDLKLENILLDQDNSIKIADFGLANFFKSDSLLDTFCGSPLYASPEIVCGVKYKGPEVDSWSLGVLLYALVYGTMPFDGRNYQILTKQITSGTFGKPPKPSDAHDLISWMLTVDPNNRATIDDIASHKWVKEVTEPAQLTPTVTQDAPEYFFYLGCPMYMNQCVEQDLNSTLKAEDKEETPLACQPKGILKNNPTSVKQQQRKKPDVDKTFEGQLAAVCELSAKDSLKLKSKPKNASGKRRVLRSRRDRESGYYSSPERIPAINEKPNSSDPTLHPNISRSVPPIKSSLANPGRLSRLPTKQHPSVSQMVLVPVGTSKDPCIVPMAPPADERLISISSDDGSSVGSRTRPTSTYSDSSILSTDSFDLCAFENSTTQRNSVFQPSTIPCSVPHQQHPFSLSLVPDTLPPLDANSVEEQPAGSLTPNSEKLVRDLQRILAPNGRRNRKGQNQTHTQNHTKRPHSVDETSQLSEMMNQLNIDLDLAYRKASYDMCANLGPSEV